ncbi:MAG: metallophosphoesterase family protein [Bacteroidota bacterium]
MRIGVISDTHVPVRARALPGEVFEIFAGVDLILHAGDLVTLDVLEELETIAPVLAVHGNVDRVEVLARLPATRQLEVWRNGLVKVDGKVWVEVGLQAEGQNVIPVYDSHAGVVDVSESKTGKPIVIGLVHGHEGLGRTTPERAARHFPDADVVVFGHSHQPMNEWRDDRLLFNPRSATDRRRAPRCSVGILEVGETVRGEIIWLEDTKNL